MNWMGPDATMPGWLLALAAISEFGGGIALVLGLFTRLFSFGLVCTMGVAAFARQSVTNPAGEYMYDFLYTIS